MRRCDVCASHIPFGQSYCPNCGQKIKSKQDYRLRDSNHTFKVVVLFVGIFLMIVSFVMASSMEASQTPESNLMSFESFDALEREYPAISKDIEKKRENTLALYYAYQDNGKIQEKYSILNDELILVDIQCVLEDDEFNYTTCSLSYDFNGWQLMICDQSPLGARDISDAHYHDTGIRLIAKMMNLDVSPLKDALMDLSFERHYYEGMHRNIVFGRGEVEIKYLNNSIVSTYIENLDSEE